MPQQLIFIELFALNKTNYLSQNFDENNYSLKMFFDTYFLI